MRTRYFYPSAKHPFSSGASPVVPVTSVSNESIVSLAIVGASILANASGSCPIVSPFVDDTFVALRLYLLPGSRTCRYEY